MITSRFLDGSTCRVFEIPRHVQAELSTLSRVLPDRHLRLMFMAREVAQDACDMEIHFCRQGLSQPSAAAAAAALKSWFDHCCGLADMPAGIIKLHTDTAIGPRWHTDLNLSWVHDLGGGQPQFKFGCTVRGFLGRVRACPDGSMVAWSVCHGGDAHGLQDARWQESGVCAGVPMHPGERAPFHEKIE